MAINKERIATSVMVREIKFNLMNPRFSASSYTTFKASVMAFMPALALHRLQL